MNFVTASVVFEACGPAFDQFVFSPADGTRGGLVCAWKDEVLSVANVVLNKNWISVDYTI
jgi:hypothetical protein